MFKFGRILVGALFIFCLSQTFFAATYTVTKIADTSDGTCDGDCSLREAIAAANGSADSDTINFSTFFNSPQTIILSGTDLIITNNGSLTINGPGADKLTVSGNNLSRVFTNNTGADTIISKLRVTGGTGTSTITTGRGGGIYNNGGTLRLNELIISGNRAANGGGANNAGTARLVIRQTAIFGNTATGSGGGLQNFSGNTTDIIRSSIYDNTCNSTGTGGGAIQANGTVNITNSTFSGNTATGGSGGAVYFNGASLIITNSTFSANVSTNNGGIHQTGANAVSLRNSIVAGNNGAAASPDFTGAAASRGNNIIGTVGTSSGWVGSDIINTNPLLSPFGFYGGIGNSYALLSNSPALDAGQSCVIGLICTDNNPIEPVNIDQRGSARPIGSGVDIGAFETNPNFTAVLPNATLNQPYNFLLASNFTGFTFLNNGGFGGIILTSGTNTATLNGTPTQTGTFNGTVQISNNTNSTNINYSLTVLAAAVTNATVSGKVVAPNGSAIANVIVTISNMSGVVGMFKTNSFGNFSMSNVPSGQVYSLNVIAKQYSFSPQNVNVTGDVTGIVITANSDTLK